MSFRMKLATIVNSYDYNDLTAAIHLETSTTSESDGVFKFSLRYILNPKFGLLMLEFQQVWSRD
jgi:hypothetical protein